MSVDETDSLIRAIATAPALPPPARLVSILLVDAPGSEARLREVAESFGAKLSTSADGVLQLSIADVAHAASCALAVRAALPTAAIVLATGPAEAAAIARAVALLESARAGTIAVDDTAAERLDGGFELETGASPRRLVGRRTTVVADRVAHSAADAIAAESYRGSFGIRLTRLIGVSLWLASVVVAYLLHPSVSLKMQLFTVGPYAAGALLLFVLLDVLRIDFLAGWIGMLLDVPCTGAFAIAVSRVAPAEAGWACGLATALCCMFTAATCSALRPRFVIITTVSSVVWLTAAYVVAQLPFTAYVALLPVLATCIVGLRLMQQVPALLHRVADEAAARIREVEVLNAELRRQIADRAAQLATALSRLQTPSEARTLHPGMVLEDRYRVVRAIGRGGVGTVYEVERIADGRKLALKVLTRATDQVSLARFAREAQTAAALNHANVVGVLDVDVTRSGMLFVVMELVAGGSLVSERRRYGDASWALPILRQIAAALTAMHARGIVHRDLKPSNILLDGRTAKVADFGLVAALAGAPLAADAAVVDASPTLTRTGSVMGTPLYMAPELARGAREANASSDVFSFGVVAYELLANALPFAAPPVLERLDGHAAPPAKPLAHTRPDLAREICAMVDGCLAHTPETRPTAERLAAAFARVAP